MLVRPIGGEVGAVYGATCRSCGHRFEVSGGGGFLFHLLRCDRCGSGKSMAFDDIGEPHLRYLKGLPGPYSMATADHDEAVRNTYQGEPLTESEYKSTVEGMAGSCKCGGSYRFDALPRCPECRSLDIELDREPEILFD
jgi:hypothetical protein